MAVAADMMVGPEGTARVGRTSTFCLLRSYVIIALRHQVLHVLELVREAVDQDHRDDVVNGHHNSTVRIEDSNEEVFLSKKEEEVIFKLRSWRNECWATAKLVARV